MTNTIPESDLGQSRGDDIAIVPAEAPVPSTPGRRQRLAEGVALRLRPLWADWRLGLAAAAGVGVVWGAIAGWWTPRSPLTTSQAIWSIIFSLGVGAAAGILMRSRWAMLAAPTMFAAVFELMRLGTDGPTVDTFSTSTYGLMALAVGRGFHALISLLPLAYGAALGAATARRVDPPSATGEPTRRWGLYTRRGFSVVAAIGLIAFTAALARPASTDPIVDANGDEIPGSIAELTAVDINGHDLHMLIRGHSTDNPVLFTSATGSTRAASTSSANPGDPPSVCSPSNRTPNCSRRSSTAARW